MGGFEWRQRQRITGHESDVYSVDFSPNCRLLAAASNDAPIYIWDVYGQGKSPPRATLKLTKENQQKLWQQLAASDAAVGFQAVCELIGRPNEAVAILKEGWNNLPRAAPQQMRQWIKDLDSIEYKVRKTATAELDVFALQEDLLRKALEQAGTLEVRQRLEDILRRQEPQRLRNTRMLEVLERLGTAQARQLIQGLLSQTDSKELSAEAAASLRRLKQR